MIIEFSTREYLWVPNLVEIDRYCLPLTPFAPSSVYVFTCSVRTYPHTYICNTLWEGKPPGALHPFTSPVCESVYVFACAVHTHIHMRITLRRACPSPDPRASLPLCPPNVWGAYVYACAVRTHLHTYM